MLPKRRVVICAHQCDIWAICGKPSPQFLQFLSTKSSIVPPHSPAQVAIGGELERNADAERRSARNRQRPG